MIKFVQCVRRQPRLSQQEFRDQWSNYADKVKAVAEAFHAKRWVLSTAPVVDQNLDIMQSPGTKAPYDGMVEIWWNHGRDVARPKSRRSTLMQDAPSSVARRKPEPISKA